MLISSLDGRGARSTFLAITDEIVFPIVAALNEALSMLTVLHPDATAARAAPSHRWRHLQRRLAEQLAATVPGGVPAADRMNRPLAAATAFLVAEAITLDAHAEGLPDDEEHAEVLVRLHAAAAGARRAGRELREARRELALSPSAPALTICSPTASEWGFHRPGRGRFVAAALVSMALAAADLLLLWYPLFALLRWSGANGLLSWWSGWTCAGLLAAGQAACVLAPARRYYAALDPPGVSGELALDRVRHGVVTAARLVGVLGAARIGLLLYAAAVSVPLSLSAAVASGLLLSVAVVSLVCFAIPSSGRRGRALVRAELFCLLPRIFERRDAQAWREVALVRRQLRYQERLWRHDLESVPAAPDLVADLDGERPPPIGWPRRVLIAAALAPVLLLLGDRLLDTASPPALAMTYHPPSPALSGAAPALMGSSLRLLAASSDLVLRDDAVTGFVPDTAVFHDSAAAEDVLAPIAATFTSTDRWHTVLLSGTTSRTGAVASQVDLSLRRAEAVRSLLVMLDVPAEQIDVRGLGSNFPEYVRDTGPDGSVLPGPAAANRTVRITLSWQAPQPQPRPQPRLVFAVTNTSETPPDGVWFRNSGRVDDTDGVPGHGVYLDDRVLVECFVQGDPVGAYANRVWYRVHNLTRPTVPISGAPNAGFVNAHYVKDDMTANQAAPGVPFC